MVEKGAAPIPSNETPGPGALGWIAFRDGLTTLDLVRRSGAPEAFRGHFGDYDFGPLKIRRVGSEGVAICGERSRARIEVFREAIYWVGIVLRGEFLVRQSHGAVTLGEGGLTVLDPTRPYFVEIPQGRIETLWIGAPRDLIEQRLIDVDAVLGIDLSDATGPGALASRLLGAAFARPLAANPIEARRISSSLLDLFATAANARLSRGVSSNYRGAILRRLKTHIEANLENSRLSVAGIAHNHGMSPRYVAKLFEREGETASTWIWSRRLERSRAALLHGDPYLTISRVAFAHGFKSISHFSRAFRERFGETPRSTLTSARGSPARTLA